VCVDCEKQKSRKQEKVGGYQGIRNNNLTEIHRKIRRIKIQRRRKRKNRRAFRMLAERKKKAKREEGVFRGVGLDGE
jgi:hypothetical protein